MAERPMIFSAPMVRALLDGTKTQTRRIINGNRGAWKVGDRLWVRETWQSAAAMNICHPADDYYVYRATDPEWETTEGWRWRPSLFMPRRASRITLEITGVRVEALQDISQSEARAEGFYNVLGFIDTWQEINGKRPACSWIDDPLVWAITFEVKKGKP